MGLDTIWKDEASRAVEVMGGEPVKYTREVADKLTIKFTADEWRKLLNVDDTYLPCGLDFVPYADHRPIHICFIRSVKDERT